MFIVFIEESTAIWGLSSKPLSNPSGTLRYLNRRVGRGRIIPSGFNKSNNIIGRPNLIERNIFN